MKDYTVAAPACPLEVAFGQHGIDPTTIGDPHGAKCVGCAARISMFILSTVVEGRTVYDASMWRRDR